MVATPVLAQPPSFDKSFEPATVGLGNLSALTFEITANGPVTDLAFSDDLPAGLTFADPVSLLLGPGCDPVTSIDFPDADSLTFTSPRLGAGATCTVRVDVLGGAPGAYTNTSGDLTSSAGNSGPASDTLNLDADLLRVAKSFTPGEVAPGGTSRLVINLANLSDFLVDEIAFTDLLPVGMTIALSPNVADDCNGTLSAPAESGSVTPGAGSLSYAGGSLVEGASCSIAVDVTVSGAGTFVNRTEGFLVGGGGTPVGFAAATLGATLEPLNLSKEFVDPVPPGGTTDLTFTLINSTRDTVTDVAFTDDLEATLAGLQVTGSIPLVPCGTGSSVSIVGTNVIDFSGGNLASGESCSFTLSVEVPADATPGTYPNTTSSVTSSAGDFSPASDDLDVGFAPGMLKQFCQPGVAATDPCTAVNQVSGGDVIIARFTLGHNDPDNTVTGLTFQDDFNAFLSGVEVSPDSQSDVCGAGSSFADTDGAGGGEVYRLTAGTLAPSATCVFQVDVQLPASVPPGTYVNETTPVQGFYGDQPVSGNAGGAQVTSALAPVLTKRFVDPVGPGGSVDLVFTLDASESPVAFTDVSFSDDLEATLSGLTVTSVPLSACGGTVSSSGSSVSLSGASVAAGDTCSFTVFLSVPADAAAGSYTNTTSTVSAIADDERVTGDPATDVLDVTVVGFQKAFTDDPVAPGGTVTLSFSIANLTDQAMAGLSFSDSLDSVVPGLAPTDLPQSDVCGAGSVLSFAAGTLALTGGNLAAGTNCTFSTVLQVPATASGGAFGNVTSALQGTLDGSPFTGPTASDVLAVTVPLSLTKSFSGPVPAGGTVELVFSLVAGTDSDLSGISFSDDLGAVLPGLVAIDLPADGFCGPGSQITGTDVLVVTGASLAAGSSCAFSVLLEMPAGAAPGSYTNTTSMVTATRGGVLPVAAAPATADVTVAGGVPTTAIPTLDFMGLLALIGLLGAFGAYRLRG